MADFLFPTAFSLPAEPCTLVHAIADFRAYKRRDDDDEYVRDCGNATGCNGSTFFLKAARLFKRRAEHCLNSISNRSSSSKGILPCIGYKYIGPLVERLMIIYLVKDISWSSLRLRLLHCPEFQVVDLHHLLLPSHLLSADLIQF